MIHVARCCPSHSEEVEEQSPVTHPDSSEQRRTHEQRRISELSLSENKICLKHYIFNSQIKKNEGFRIVRVL